MHEKMKIIEERLKNAIIEQFDVYLVKEKIYEHQYIKEKVQISREAEAVEYYIRILNQIGDGTGIGIVRANSFDPSQLDSIIKTALKLVKINRSSRYILPESDLKYSAMNPAESQILVDPNQALEEKSEELRNEIALQKDVSPTFGRLRVHHRYINLLNSNGLDLETDKTFLYVEQSLKSQDATNIAEYWAKGYYKNLDQLNFSEIIPEWAKFSQDNLKAVHPHPIENLVVLFPPKILLDALNPVLGHHASGEAFHEKTSRFEIGQQVANENFTLTDNGLLENGLQSNSWDGEGTPRQKTLLIKDGIFQNYIYDQKYALLEKTNSTGNGIRTSEGSIANTPSNLIIQSGNYSLDEIIRDLKNGIYVVEFSWLNPSEVTGTFGAEIRLGYEIENGEIMHPIKGGNLGGNVLDMIHHMKHISKERKLVENALFPYMTFENLVLSI